jgi:tetratricopeptide (TPR) repeat protein
MGRRSALLVAAVGSLAQAISGVAFAQPSIWDTAREPVLAAEYQMLTSVESFLLGHATAWDEMNVHKGTIDYLRGDRYLDPRLEFLLGALRVEATLRGEQGVRERLLETLERYPDSSLAPRGLLEVARIAALQADLENARAFFGRALENLWEPELRASAYYGRAKATMEGGRPRDALDDYRSAIRVARSSKSRALAHWGLGVALERSGYLNAAFVELRIAISIPVRSTAFVARTVLDLPDVFFVPDYDRHYYKGLAAMAEAEQADAPAQGILDFQTALAYFERYLREAQHTQHPYVTNARRLGKLCLARIEQLQQREAALIE